MTTEAKMTKTAGTAWKTIKTGTTADGAEIELRYAKFGKGRQACESWKIYRDGVQVGYASVARDVEVNFERALSGLVRNPETGNYVPASN